MIVKYSNAKVFALFSLAAFMVLYPWVLQDPDVGMREFLFLSPAWLTLAIVLIFMIRKPYIIRIDEGEIKICRLPFFLGKIQYMHLKSPIAPVSYDARSIIFNPPIVTTDGNEFKRLHYNKFLLAGGPGEIQKAVDLINQYVIEDTVS